MNKTKTEEKNETALINPAEGEKIIRQTMAVISKVASDFIEGIRVEMKTNKSLIQYFGAITVKSAKDLEIAGDIRASIKKYFKAKSDERDIIIGPVKDEIKAADAAFKKFKDYVEDTIAKVDEAVAGWRTKEAARIAKENAAEMARIAKEAAKVEEKLDKSIKGTRGEERTFLQQQQSAAVAAVVDSAEIKEQDKTVGGMTFKKIPDRDKIQAAIDKADGKIEIAGIKVIKLWDFEIVDTKAIPDEFKKEIPSTRS